MSIMTTLNIVELIENNPIARLSNTYQGRLVSKIQSKFNTEDQKLFVASFYSYLNYNSKTDFVIDLDNVWKWIGFGQKDTAKRILEKFFILNKDYNVLLRRSPEQKKGRGGHNKETFMLTINAFKRFCLKAETKKADQIHDYYIKLEETLHEIINEESNELKIQLEEIKIQSQKNDQQNKKTIETLTKEKKLEKQAILLREFGNAGAMIYIIRVKTRDNGEYIIKIGESRRGIEGRYNEHKSNYDEAILLDCFMVKRSRDFENFLHNHKDIRFNQITNLTGHENERELFLIGKNLSYGTLVKIIKDNINNFNEFDIDSIKNDIESIKTVLLNNFQPIQIDATNIENIIERQNLLISKINNLEITNKEIMEKLNALSNKTITGFNQPVQTIGPRLQKINPETMQLIKTYETVSECMRENSNIKRPSINKAIKENTIYNGFRWTYVDRELDSNIIHNIQETKKTNPQNLGYITKLDSSKSKILNIYLDRKTAALQNGYSMSGLDNHVKHGSLTKGFFYILYENCSDELKTNFIIKNMGKTPLLYKSGVGLFDSNNNMTTEFSCKYDCIRKMKISDKTLAKALDKNVQYQGNYFRSLGEKLSI